MAINVTSENIIANIKASVPEATGADIKYLNAPNDPIWNKNFANYSVDLSDSKKVVRFAYSWGPFNVINGFPENTIFVGLIETTAEWLIALVQDVVNADLRASGGKEIPITGEFDCATQRAMVMEKSGATATNLTSESVANLDADILLYTLNRSEILRTIISSAAMQNTAIVANAEAISGTGTLPFVIFPATSKMLPVSSMITPEVFEVMQSKTVAAAARATCGAAMTDDTKKTDDLTEVKDKEDTAGEKKTSYFWPAVGGIAAGAVLIGGGYFLLRKKPASSSSRF
jgi:hypothetical protein